MDTKTAVITGVDSGIGFSLQNAWNTQMSRKPVHLQRSDWASDNRLWNGVLEGKDIGTGVTVLFYTTEEIGKGPVWHVHPSDESFIVRAGRALITIGEEKIEATAGQILLGPANVPHKFTNLGPGLLETTDIHVSDQWIQTDLDDPEFVRDR